MPTEVKRRRRWRRGRKKKRKVEEEEEEEGRRGRLRHSHRRFASAVEVAILASSPHWRVWCYLAKWGQCRSALPDLCHRATFSL